jgi:hypothetical protein
MLRDHYQLEEELKKLKRLATQEMNETLFHDRKRIKSFEGKITYIGILTRLIEVKKREDPVFAQLMEKRKNLNKKLYMIVAFLLGFVILLIVLISLAE